MLDYYGECIKDNSQIDNELISYFKDYNTNFIIQIIEQLRLNGTLPNENSVSGWNIFVKKYIIEDIKKIIQKETLNSYKKLQFIKYCDSNNLNIDISRLIFEM